jgi:heme-degrading monooxygenase HmoA
MSVMSNYHLAQVNVGVPLAPLESPLLAEFVKQLVPINRLADESPGFVWRLQTAKGDATAVKMRDERLIVNMSVWQSLDALSAFVYRSEHVAVMRQRRRWFESMRIYMALWWVPAGHLPSVEDAESRLAHLAEHGPTPTAFTFRAAFAPPGVADSAPSARAADACPA